ncbi:hypothetical protein [Shewanella sp.]|uniref:hypothetical protein n=1 Tax=Shewanella sp. TaxID=50422 RepID=UPI003A9875F5
MNFLRTFFRAIALSSAACSPVVLAAEVNHPQSGSLLASIVIMMLVGGYTLVNIPLQALFYFNGQYQSSRCVRWHSTIGIFIALFGAALAIYDQRTLAEMAFYLGLVLVAIAIASLPFLIKNSAKAPTANAGSYLLIASLCYLLPALLFSSLITPFAIVLALVASQWQTNKSPLFNMSRWLLVIVSTGWFIHQLVALYETVTRH